jgi:hypothetical protein
LFLYYHSLSDPERETEVIVQCLIDSGVTMATPASPKAAVVKAIDAGARRDGAATGTLGIGLWPPIWAWRRG